MLDPRQFRDRVVAPVLHGIDLWSPVAEALVLGTAVQESGLRVLEQDGGGPALGVYQIEPATHGDVWQNFLAYRTPLSGLVARYAGAWPSRTDQLATNMAYATAICRVIYFRAPAPLPAAIDADALAAYWKQHFNTPGGAGRPEEYSAKFRQFVAPIYVGSA